MTRAHARILSAAAALGAALAMTPAHAIPARVYEIPNGNVNSCYTCHLNGTYSWNAFGNDLRNNYGINNRNAPPIPWAQVYNNDSDQDGQTNGQELGDPCGVWVPGCDPQFTTGVSNPGLASSTTSTIPTCANAPKAPACSQGGTGQTGGSPQGTTSAAGCTAASGPASLGAFLLIGLAGLLARRRLGRAGR